MTITPERAESFAAEWIAAWNARDLLRVLSHYTDDFEMSSPFIEQCYVALWQELRPPGGRSLLFNEEGLVYRAAAHYAEN